MKKLVGIFFLLFTFSVYSGTIDSFDNLNSWKIFSQGLQLEQEPGVINNCMVMNFDLYNKDYVVVVKEIKINLPENYEFTFYLKGECPPNNLEFKLVDESGNVFWKKWENMSINSEWTKIVIDKKDLKFGWGPKPDEQLTSVKKIELAISRGDGGKGKICIDELNLKKINSKIIITASTSEGPEFSPDKAFDGDMSTRWSSKFHDPQWLKIDFGVIKQLVGLTIYWEKAYGKTYDIKVSTDANNWTTVFTTNSSDGGKDEIDFSETAARYLKITGRRRGTYWGYSIKEINFKTSAEPWGEKKSAGVFYKKEWFFKKDTSDLGEYNGWSIGISKIRTNQKINSGMSWQRQGYYNYKGTAWYTNNYFIPSSWKNTDPMLIVNDIYDTYTLFINGIEFKILNKNDHSEFNIKEYLKYGEVNSITFKVTDTTGKGGIIGSVILIKNRQALKDKISEFQQKSPKEYYSFLAELKPEGYFPYWLKKEQGFWTVAGSDNGYKESLVYEDGTVEPYKSFSIFPYLFIDGQLITRRDVKLFQSLEKGYLPIPSVTWQYNKLKFRITVLNTGDTSSSVTYIRYTLENESNTVKKGRLFISFRPFEINPPWQWGGLHNIYNINFTEDKVSINDFDIHFVDKPVKTGAVRYYQGDIIEYLEKDNIPASQKINDNKGFASGAAVYDFNIEPGKKKGFFIAVTLYKNQPFIINKESEYDRYFSSILNSAVSSWDKKLNGTEFIIPDKDVFKTIKSNLSFIFVNKDGPAFQPGSRAYEASWIRDGALTSAALLRMGYKQEIRDYLDWYEKYIYKDGRVPAIIIIDRNEINPVKEYDSQGEFIFTLMQYYRFTKDKAYLISKLPAVIKILKYLEQIRKTRLTSKYRNGSFYGILPNSVSHEGYYPEPGNHSYWDDFWALKGWKDAREIFHIAGKPDLEEWAYNEEHELRSALYNSIQYTINEKNIDFIPGCADLGDFDPTSTAISLTVCNENSDLPQIQFRNTFKKYYDNVIKRLKPGWTGSFTPYEIRNVQALLYMNQKEKALKLFDFLLTYRRPAGWRQWSEAVYKPVRDNGYIGDMPHTWVSSGFINTVRSFFLYENEKDQTLIVSAGIPEKWLDDNQKVGINNAPTYWGNISYIMNKEKDTLRMKIRGDIEPGEKIIFKSPVNETIGSVKVNNKNYGNFIGNKIIIESLPADIIISY